MFGTTPSRCSLKSRYSQHAHVKVRLIQTAFTYTSIALQPIRVNETRRIPELTSEEVFRSMELLWLDSYCSQSVMDRNYTVTQHEGALAQSLLPWNNSRCCTF